MADVALEIYGENGGIQVLGDGGIGFGLAAAGNLTLTDDGFTHPQPMVTGQITVTGTNPILAFSGQGAICVERVTVTGSTFRWNVRAQSNRQSGYSGWSLTPQQPRSKTPRWPTSRRHSMTSMA